MPANWPGSLPQFALNGADIVPRENTARTQLGNGEQKVRRLYTRVLRDYTVKFVFKTLQQVLDLDTFYQTTCAGGQISFYITSPKDDTTILAGFSRAPRIRRTAIHTWEVDIGLEDRLS